ncbi:hypothetical protein [Streptomyces sp. URMC 123]|uniref:hypothetical protein n=1 Tax=Streptomyces sp. URMC 123 TaxID=3423403 RepID=UPI003F1B0C51
MSDWAMYVVVPEDGAHEVYEARFGAVGLDLDLLAGPDVVLPLIRARPRVEGPWRGEAMCEAAVLIDLRRKALLLFAWEGPITRMRHRAATWELLRTAWPDWELRWTYDGPAALLARLGLDPEAVRDRDRFTCPEFPLEADDEELSERDPLVRVVTVGANRCHLFSAVNDHPITEGPALLERLAAAPRYEGVCRIAADSGLHLDPERRRVGWWLLNSLAGAYDMASRWPGWTVTFWEDRWGEHVRASGGGFVPPPVDRVRALDELSREARDHWSVRSVRSSSPVIGWMQAAAPDGVRESTLEAIHRSVDTRLRLRS